MKRILLALILLIVSSLCMASTLTPLPANKAFQLSATAKDNQTAVLTWTMAPHYYLYRSRFSFKAVNKNNAQLGDVILPPGIKKYNPTTGSYQAYEDVLTLAVPVLNHKGSTLNLLVHYQGCSSDGFCYPPMNKILSINMTGNYGMQVTPLNVDIAPVMLKTATPIPVSSQDKITRILAHSNIGWIILAFFGFGILISLTPCVLPMIPILSSIIIGHSKQGPLSHARSFCLALAYVLGMAITYAIVGMIFGYLGSNIQTALQLPWVIILFTLIFIALALSMFGYYDIQIPAKLQTRLHKGSDKQKRGSYIGVAIMGAIASLVMSPCVTPPLVGALGFISKTGNAFTGGAALFALGIGMGMPLLVIGATSAKLLPKAGPWMDAIKNLLGILLLAVAITLLARIVPTWANLSLWALLALGCSFTIGTFKSAIGLWAYTKKSIGILLFIYAILSFASLTQGNTDPLRPLSFTPHHAQQAMHFIPVSSINEVEIQLQKAAKARQPVMLEFAADWCISCKELDQFTFSNPRVQAALSHYRLLRANVTANSLNDQMLEKHFDVIAPPTILFFNAYGHEIKPARIIGELPPDEFLKRIP